MKIPRLALAAVAVAATLGLGGAQAQEITICYDVHVQVADQAPIDQSGCQTLPPPAE